MKRVVGRERDDSWMGAREPLGDRVLEKNKAAPKWVRKCFRKSDNISFRKSVLEKGKWKTLGWELENLCVSSH